MPFYALDSHQPVVHSSAYVHPSADIIGDVIIEADCFIGPNAVLRGDFGRIHVQHHSNIQDCCVLHSFPNKHCVVEAYGHVGHAAVLHGCHLESNVLVGMNAVIMDDAVIAKNSIIAASSFVAAKFTCQPQSLIVGVPAKVKRQLSDAEVDWKSQGTQEYVELASRYLAGVREVSRDSLASEATERQDIDRQYDHKPEG